MSGFFFAHVELKQCPMMVGKKALPTTF